MELDPVKIVIEGLERFSKENYHLITTIETSGRHKKELW